MIHCRPCLCKVPSCPLRPSLNHRPAALPQTFTLLSKNSPRRLAPPNPTILSVPSPCAPTNWKIPQLFQTRIKGEHFFQSNDCGVRFGWRIKSDKLPAVIILIVTDMQNGSFTLNDAPKCDNCAVRWLIEFPVLHSLN